MDANKILWRHCFEAIQFSRNGKSKNKSKYFAAGTVLIFSFLEILPLFFTPHIFHRGRCDRMRLNFATTTIVTMKCCRSSMMMLLAMMRMLSLVFVYVCFLFLSFYFWVKRPNAHKYTSCIV